jgi:general secretion pathway protein C
LPLRLIATLVGEDPAWSFAAIVESKEGWSRLLPLGGKVMPEVHITAIHERRVYLRHGDRSEYLDLGVTAPSTGSRLPAAGAGEAQADLARGVRQVRDGGYEIERETLDRVLSSTSQAAAWARITPAVTAGQPAGFTIDRIRLDSVFGVLGLRNGDVVHALNGRSIRTPEDALLVYTQLRKATHVVLSFTRQSKPMTHDYTIR